MRRRAAAPRPEDGVEPRPALSIVIPVYNGARTIAALVEALAEIQVPGGMEVVLVNDGSPDDSLAVCRSVAATSPLPITVISHSRNFGEHNAVMTGLRHAAGGHVITMDDDLQNPPSEVLRLYEFCRDGGHDVVYTHYAAKKHAGWRNLGSRFNGWVAGFLLDKPQGLYLSSFRCMSAFLVGEVIRYEGPFPYIDGLILQVTRAIGTLQVSHLPRAEGRSNYNLRRLIRLWLNMALNFSIMPLRAATLLGLVLSGIGALGLLAVLIEALTDDPPAGWASTVAIVMLLGGAQLLMIGVAGEYLGRLFLTVNRRPQSILRSIERPAPPTTPKPEPVLVADNPGGERRGR